MVGGPEDQMAQFLMITRVLEETSGTAVAAGYVLAGAVPIYDFDGPHTRVRAKYDISPCSRRRRLGQVLANWFATTQISAFFVYPSSRVLHIFGLPVCVHIGRRT